MQGPQESAVTQKKLSRRDLSLTVPPELRHLPPDLIQEEMDRRRTMLERFDVLNPRFKERLRNYVMGAVILLPLITWLVTPVGFKRLWLQFPLAAAYGAFLAFTRSGPFTSLGVSLLYVLILWFVVGGLKMPHASLGGFLLLVGSVMMFVVIGWALGATEELKRMDGS